MSVTKKPSASVSETNYREAFLKELSKTIAEPTTKFSTVRWWTKDALEKLTKGVRNRLSETSLDSSLSHQSLWDWMSSLGLANRLDQVEEEIFYLLELGATSSSFADPRELMMAKRSQGVICYFSAIDFHSLSTQHVPHHHIARLVEPRKTSSNESTKPPKATSPNLKARQRAESLGTILFHHQGLSFYETRRSGRLVPGTQQRAYGPKTIIRITDYEQTLLDTLFKPKHCGGPDVVFEAWEQGLRSWHFDEERVVEYLRSMQYPATTRRVATMLALQGHQPGKELKQFFEETNLVADALQSIALLPGMKYKTLHPQWKVLIP